MNVVKDELGYSGSAYITTASTSGAGTPVVYTPPTGKVIVGFQPLHNSTTITTLTPINDPGSNTYYMGTTAPVTAVTPYPITGHGTGATAFTAITLSGLNIITRGRWSGIAVGGNTGAAIVYLGVE
jgi:hypothetical protein